MNATMHHVYVDPYMVLFVHDTLNALGWGDRVVYPTAVVNFCRKPERRCTSRHAALLAT